MQESREPYKLAAKLPEMSKPICKQKQNKKTLKKRNNELSWDPIVYAPKYFCLAFDQIMIMTLSAHVLELIAVTGGDTRWQHTTIGPSFSRRWKKAIKTRVKTTAKGGNNNNGSARMCTCACTIQT